VRWVESEIHTWIADRISGTRATWGSINGACEWCVRMVVLQRISSHIVSIKKPLTH
jgi:hypothetical protein